MSHLNIDFIDPGLFNFKIWGWIIVVTNLAAWNHILGPEGFIVMLISEASVGAIWPEKDAISPTSTIVPGLRLVGDRIYRFLYPSISLLDHQRVRQRLEWWHNWPPIWSYKAALPRVTHRLRNKKNHSRELLNSPPNINLKSLTITVRAISQLKVIGSIKAPVAVARLLGTNKLSHANTRPPYAVLVSSGWFLVRN